MHEPTLLDQLSQLFESKQKQLYITAMAITKDRASAEDAVLDALLAIAELKQAPNDLPAYLFRVVRNKALHCNKHRSRFTDETALGQFIDPSTLDNQTAEQQIMTRQILNQLESLEQNQQQVLIMKLFGDLTFDEIAKITENSPNTVGSWYRRGLIQLKEKIHESAV